VLVQTFTPEHPCIAHAATHDFGAFVEGELSHRRAHNYPPYQRLARIIIRSRDQQAGGDFSERMAAAFQLALHALPEADRPRLLGPAEAPVFRLKGHFRYHFQLQSPSPAVLHKVLRAVLPTVHAPAGVEYTLDIDPFNML
jgi:primosomal protein N' (replication factor Y) (superfamily II helicase)